MFLGAKVLFRLWSGSRFGLLEKAKAHIFFRLQLEPTLISTMSTQITEQADPVSDLLAMCSRSCCGG